MFSELDTAKKKRAVTNSRPLFVRLNRLSSGILTTFPLALEVFGDQEA